MVPKKWHGKKCGHLSSLVTVWLKKCIIKWGRREFSVFYCITAWAAGGVDGGGGEGEAGGEAHEEVPLQRQ